MNEPSTHKKSSKTQTNYLTCRIPRFQLVEHYIVFATKDAINMQLDMSKIENHIISDRGISTEIYVYWKPKIHLFDFNFMKMLDTLLQLTFC